MLREVIFGVGLNQLTGYCAERMPNGVEHEALRNAMGSMTAGVMAGYLSHVPHNLSTLKLLNPAQSYAELFKYVGGRPGLAADTIPLTSSTTPNPFLLLSCTPRLRHSRRT